MLEEGLVVFLMGVGCGAVRFVDEWDGLGAAAGVFPACSCDKLVKGLVEFSVLVCTEVGDGCV